MAPTRRRSDAEILSGGEETEQERSPKARRLSSGSSGSSGSRASQEGSTTHESSIDVSVSTGASSSTHGHDDDDDGDVGVHDVDEHDGEGENGEEDEEVVEAQRSASKGKGKRRAASGVDDEASQEEEEEEDEAEKENRRVGVAGEIGGAAPNDVSNAAGAAGDGNGGGDRDGETKEPSSSPTSAQGRREDSRGSSGEKHRKKKKKKGKRALSEAGVVLKIYVENFMCHRKLSVSLGRSMNFISGRNGSGKSAILAALQICLGARAHLTHRAKKMRDFIRHGSEWDAVLEVTLLNSVHGFRFEEYGDSITIRRTIKLQGGGGFVLLGHDGAIKSRDRSEMSRMLDEFNIQVDNPCAVLDQENSKMFLQGSERDKYNFFMRALDLDRILALNDATGGKITTMRNGHHNGLDQLPRYRAEIKQLKQERKEHESLHFLQGQIFDLKERVVWAHVAVKKDELEDLTESVGLKSLYITELAVKIAGFEKTLTDSGGEKEEIKARWTARVAETRRLKDMVGETVKDLKAAKVPLLGLESRRSHLEAEKREKKAVKEAATKKLKAAREMARRNTDDDQEKSLLDDIERTEASLANVAQMKAERGGEEKMLELRTALQTATNGADNAKEELHNANTDLTARKTELSSLESGTFDPTSAIAHFMPALVRMIAQQARQFRHLPVGPIGASIQLKEESKQYCVCIEGHLRKNIANFVVSCQQDKTTLMTLMRSFRGNRKWTLPTIVVQTGQGSGKQARYTTVPQNPPGYLQIMQAINVTDDQAFNCLVDQCSIEKICLFPSKEEAEKACLRGASGSYARMPHGMFEAYYPSQGGKSCNKFTVASDGNMETRMNTVNANRHTRVLGVDQDTQRREAAARVQRARAAVAQVRTTADADVRSLNTAKAALEKEEAERDRLEKQEGLLAREKSKLSTKLMALRAKKSGATDPTEELQREVDVAAEALEEVVKELAALKTDMAKVAKTIDPVEKAADNARQAHKESGDAAIKVQEELEKAGAREDKTRRNLNRAQAALAKENKELEDLSTRATKAKRDAEEEEEKATAIMKNLRIQRGEPWDGEKVPPEGTLEKLGSMLATKKQRYEKEREKRNLKSKSMAEVKAQLAEAIKNFDTIDGQLNALEGNMNLLADERLKRSDMWKALLTYAAKATSQRFNEYLMTRGASGEVNFDHVAGTMSMAFQVDSGNDASQCKDVRQLSGGERSFATLAMLLALGRSCECPFRVMDEFDVFMDAMSRNAAIQLLINFAKLDEGRQFILITPQDLSSVTASDRCKIIKMKPPRKGDHNQATLEESFGGGAT